MAGNAAEEGLTGRIGNSDQMEGVGGVDAVTDMLTTRSVMIVGGTSGFLGSLFAAFVWRRKS